MELLIALGFVAVIAIVSRSDTKSFKLHMDETRKLYEESKREADNKSKAPEA